MSQFKIYQTFHKPFIRNSTCDWIAPIGVNGYSETGFLSDGSGDNIGALNPYFCELTAQYWVWKNTSHGSVGFYHYRRYLNFLPDETWNINAMVQMPATDPIVSYLSSERQGEKITQLLTVYDVIIPKKANLLPSIDSHYRQHMTPEPWDQFITTLRTVPAYKDVIDCYVNELCTAPICNMFIMKRDIFNEYCSEMFPLLTSIFTLIGKPFNDYNNRYVGFLAERFLGIWLSQRKVSSYEVPLVILE
jgi:hypothetical protein